MVLSAPWVDSLVIITLNPLKKNQVINPMCIIAPWDGYLKKQLFTNMKMWQTTLLCNKKNCKGLTQWDFVPLWPTIKTNNSSQS